jgi:serine/threonine protein kinase
VDGGYNPVTLTTQLATGDRVGAYQIVSPLGAGGMGEVFRARDTRLNREVAIKILPPAFADDADRLARFTREAQTLAALNHPNIAQIHGFEESSAATGGVHALVMELVPGEDLSTITGRGPLSIPDALSIARQIADALEAAHDQGIIHRDLKPGNVKVRPDGAIKVLDFGLAKALAPEAAGVVVDAMNSPTLTQRATQLGTIIGTAAYMAPEQARGKAVDRRADIWAFGVVLYEMLTGARAFDGDDTSEVLATVLKTEPNWHSLPADTPPSVRRLLRRCLEKDPRKRLSSIADARLELEDTDPPAPAPQPAVHRQARTTTGTLIAATAFTTAAATFVTMQLLGAGGGTSPAGNSSLAAGSAPIRLSIAVPDGDQVTDSNHLPLAISPDGSQIVYVGRRDGGRKLFLRRLGDVDAVVLPGTEGGRMPFFSPDGQWIAFFTNTHLKKVAVASGALQNITDISTEARGGAWAFDGTIYYAPHNVSPLWKVAASGGTPAAVTQLDRARGEISHRWPQVLPDGSLLLSVWTGPGPDEHSIATYDPATGSRRTLLNLGDTPRLVATGHLAYARLDTLFAVPWRDTRKAPDDAAPLSLPELPRIENEGAADYAVSSNGTLAYVAGGPARYAQRVVWVDRAGPVEALPLPERDYEAVQLSPDGTRAVLQIREGSIGLWVYDFARQTLTPFATTSGSSQGAVWTTDGGRIIYRATRQGTRNLHWKPTDGSGQEERLTNKPDVVQTPSSVSPDGRWVVFSEGGGLEGGSTWVMSLTGERTPRLLVSGVNARFSPDGKWIAYQSAESGTLEVYVSPFPGPGPRIPVSAGGGDSPLWAPDGRELYYVRNDRMMGVTVAGGATLSVSAPRMLYEGRYRGNLNTITPFDISRDGRRFLRIQQAQPDRPVTRIEVVLNWASQLTR